MSLADGKQQKKAMKLAAQMARKRGHSAGGTLPPGAPPGRWYGDPSWIKVAVSVGALLVAAAMLYYQVAVRPTPAAEQSSPSGGQTAGSSLAAVGDVGKEVVELRPSLPAHGLHYEELITAGGDPASALPMVIAVHGLGDRPDRFKKLLAQLPFPARIIVPRAPGDYHQGYTWFPTQIEDGHVTRLDHGVMRNSAQRLAWLAEAMTIKWPAAGRPVITGFSQGGILSFVVAANHPDVVVAAIPMSGLWPQELRPRGPFPPGIKLPVLVALHGADDGLVPNAGAVESVAAMKALGMDATIESFPDVAHRVSAEMRKRLFELLRLYLVGSEVAYLTSAM